MEEEEGKRVRKKGEEKEGLCPSSQIPLKYVLSNTSENCLAATTPLVVSR